MSTPDLLPSKKQFAFLATKRFLPLFGTQFFGALNDNLFKTTLFVLISFYGLGAHSWIPSSQMLNIGALLYILPFFLFSALSGEICNKFDKAIVARWIKVAEIVIMILAVIGFLHQTLSVLLLALFLMGVHSTLFGPLKYSILPEYLEGHELLSGNSLIECGTFLAILFGQILGTMLAGTHIFLLATILIIIAVLGQISSIQMPRVPAQFPQQCIEPNIARSTLQLLRQTYQQKNVWMAIMGISWFWFLGSIYITQLPTFTRLHLGGNDQVFNLMLTLFSIGIGTGSILCARISKHKLHLSLVAFGTVGLSLSGMLLVWLTSGANFIQIDNIFGFVARHNAFPIMLSIICIGFFGGFFSLPLYTWLQTASTDNFRSHAIAANNIINGLFMVVASVMSVVLIWLFDNINALYFIVAAGNLPVLYYLSRNKELRIDFMRFILRKQ
ncbi:MAG: MFS transporter [Snodgrassella sp.]|nr:MFS transporter [Snodgrassella sp.]